MVVLQSVVVILWIALFARIGWALLKPAATGLPAQVVPRRA